MKIIYNNIAKIVRIFIILITPLSITMCSKDLGNYNYIDIPVLSIDTTGIPYQYTIKQFSQDLTINPKVIYSGKSTLDYYWILGFSNDTISRDPNLKVKLSNPISSSKYPLFFVVKERNTGNFSAIEFKVLITGNYPSGLMIAHEKDGTCDIDLIGSPTSTTSTLFRNIHQTMNNSRLRGTPVGLGSVGRNAYVMFMTNEEGSLMTFSSMKRQFDYRETFGALNPGVLKPEAFGYYAASASFWINNGKVYSNPTGTSTSGLINQKLIMEDMSDYRVAPFYIRPTAKGGIFFDELNNRFIQLGYHADNVISKLASAGTGARFSLDNINKKLLFAAYGFQLSSFFLNTTLYAFFADHIDLGKRYLYVIDIDNAEKPDLALLDLGTANEISSAKYFEVFSSSPCVYYATDKKIYLLQINAGGNSYVNAGVQFEAPANEFITCIKIASRFYVSTWNQTTGEGKVYQFSPATGTGTLGSIVKSWSEFGGVIKKMELKIY